MDTIKEALTFDDVLLLPRYSNILPSKTNISMQLTKKISLKVPFLTSAMDTVTESKMAIAIAKEGGMGIIHRNLDIKKQSFEIKKVKHKKLIVGAAIGTNLEDLERARSLIFNGVDLIVIDTAHGHSEKVLKMLSKIKIISDGGIKFSGDIAKALAAGADAIMMGSIFAGTDESPGKKFKIKGKLYKQYRGMGSIGAMSAGSANRYFQKNFKDKSKFVPEGVEGRVEYKGKVSKIIYQLQGGLRSSMGYIGAKNLIEINKKAKFVKITKAGFYESMVHSVETTQKMTNYKL